MKEETLLPPHGRIACAACFNGRAEWGKSRATSDDGWTLDNNPCAFGAQNPRFLLLGFSKGERQSAGILTRQHNDIPYAGFRPRLTGGLQKLGSLTPTDTVDAHIRSDEPDWAFGSLVRCTLAKDGKKSGTIIPSSVRSASYETWRKKCTDLYLFKLPPRLQVVVMLSNDDATPARPRYCGLHAPKGWHNDHRTGVLRGCVRTSECQGRVSPCYRCFDTPAVDFQGGSLRNQDDHFVVEHRDLLAHVAAVNFSRFATCAAQQKISSSPMA